MAADKIKVPAFLENVFGTSYGKRALLSYITHPLAQRKLPPTHGNIPLCRELAKAILAENHDLDVIHYMYNGELDYSKYEFIIGFGVPFERSFYTGYSGKRLYFATGAYTGQRNPAELFRIRDLHRRHGVLAQPARLKDYPDFASSILCDAIICTGNDWTLDTYAEVFDGDIYRAPVIAYSYYTIDNINRDWERAKNAFLWFGGAGCILKGLDICIEAFLALPTLELHICGPENCEALQIYSDAISKAGNIFYHGFVDVSSHQYRDILEKCGFVIFPSASEAGAGSVLDTMATGLIPIVTREASVDVDEFGYLLDDPDISTLRSMIRRVSVQDNATLERRARLSYEFSVSSHSADVFRESASHALHTVLTGMQDKQP